MTKKGLCYEGAALGSTIAAMTFGAFALGGTPAEASLSPQERSGVVMVYDIPAGLVATALNAFAVKNGLHLLYDARVTRMLRTTGLSGSFSMREGLDRLLEGTGLSYRFGGPDEKAVSIILAQNDRGARSDAGFQALPPIDVGATKRTDVEATNPDDKKAYSADRGAITEGTGTYTTPLVTVAGKVPLPRKEIPQSVSVMTRGQMNDMQLTTVQDAMFWVPGVSTIANDVTQGWPASRGYTLGVAYDGVPTYDGLAGYQQLDLAVYDRIEVLKGPAGLLSGAGNPGGIVNIVRKRPQDEFKLRTEFTAGSWDNYRGLIDVTGPINEERTFRYRALVLHQDKHFFFTPSQPEDKWLGYGSLEYDITPNTLLNVAYTRQRTSDPAYSGQPVAALSYFGGTSPYFLNVPRSWNPYPDWTQAKWDTEDKNIRLEHRFGEDWVAKVNFNRRDIGYEFADAYPNSGVNPSNWTAQYARRHYMYYYHRTGLDSYLSGTLPWAMIKNTLTIGYNYDRFTYEYKGAPRVYVNNIPVFWPNAIGPNLNPFTAGGQNQTLQHGAYSQLRLTPIGPLTFVFGGRLTNFFAKNRNVFPSAPANWSYGAKSNHRFSPYLAGIFRATDEINFYGSYSDIFIPQTNQKADGTTLDPQVGGQFEAGVKGEFLNKKLNASAAWFEINDRNRPYADPANPGYYLQAGKAESTGVEVEFSGKPLADIELPIIQSPLPGLDVVGGYTYLQTKLIVDKNSPGRPISSWYPTHMFKIWGKYDFEGEWKGLTIGAGVVAESGLSGAINTLNEARHGPAFAVINAMTSYKINDHLTLQFNLNNITDQKYYMRVGGANTYNTPGDPRNFMVTLRGEL
ncbi:TonB-dependent receptor [Methylocystis sp. Sn-Cys]|uniref:TonB-dependent siderophore receptor n=1 Tax=Methylocystis sp. Sn-Cys TaxID=1701263 RepID=UPI0019230614|nr:TonB-dependent receptor [Methylocystis sp. Sn-Cys]MBL1257874.1 TonB-dependent siderophore receptor [Methylocystis sp. Sn-Cys]